MNTFNRAIHPWAEIAILGSLLLTLFLSSLVSYLLFHTLAELFSIIIAAAIFVLIWNFRPFYKEGFLIFIGTAYLATASIDLLHTLAFKGMGVFPTQDANLATQLWIAARWLQSLSMLLAPLFLGRRVRLAWLLPVFGLVTSLLIASIFVWRIFPVCFIEGVGQTPFKIYSEYVIDLILAAAALQLYRKRPVMDRRVNSLLILALAFMMIGELAFTLYIDVDGISNLVGHYFKIVAFYLVYKAIIQTEAGSIYADMNQLRHTEQALRASEAQAQASLAELRLSEQTLQEYAEKLQRSNQDLERFAFVASHDLQEPLRKIKLFSEGLQRGWNADLPDEARDYLARIQSASGRMQRMIDGLLELSRISTHSQSFELVSLKTLVDEALNDLETRLQASHGQVLVSELPYIEADPLQIRQLFQNLIGNGLKFCKPDLPPLVRVLQVPRLILPGASLMDCSDQGSGLLSGDRLSSAARLDRYATSPCVTIQVEDNGIGFEQEHASRIFQPFQRLHGKSEYEGTGLGLAICQKIVERHHGNIEAYGRPGEGAIFIITLPVRQRPSA